MDWHIALDKMSGVLMAIALALYVKAVWVDRNKPFGTVGKIEPRKSTWVAWFAVDVVTLLGMYARNVHNFQIIIATTGSGIVLALTLCYGAPCWKKFDLVCLSGALVGVALWQFFSDPVLGIAISQVANFIGAVPTIKSVWRDPGKEPFMGWVIGFTLMSL